VLLKVHFSKSARGRFICIWSGGYTADGFYTDLTIERRANNNELNICSSFKYYKLPSLNLQRKQLDGLNACWNSVIRRIFSFKRTTSVKEVLHGFGRLNIKHLVVLRKVKFYRKMSPKKGLLHDVFSVYLLDSCMSDDCLTSVFLLLNVAKQRVYDSLGSMYCMFLVNGSCVSFMSACTFYCIILNSVSCLSVCLL